MNPRIVSADGLLRIRFLTGYIIGTLESRFRKRQVPPPPPPPATTFPRRLHVIFTRAPLIATGSRQAGLYTAATVHRGYFL